MTQLATNQSQEIVKPIETGLPKLLVIQYPACHVAKWLGRQLQCVFATMASAPHQSCTLQHFHMLAKAGERNRKGLCEIGNAAWSVSKALQDSSPGRIGNGRGDAIHTAARIVNHMVHYNCGATFCQPVSIFLLDAGSFGYNVRDQLLVAPGASQRSEGAGGLNR